LATTNIESLRLLRRDIGDIAPLALFLDYSHRLFCAIGCLSRVRLVLIDAWLRLLDVQDGGDAQSERRPRHQVRNDALVRLAFVDLPELLLVVHLHPDAILEHVLNVLATLHLVPVLVFNRDHFLEVRRVAPCDLDGGRSLRNVREDARSQTVLLNNRHVLLDGELLRVDLRAVFAYSNIIHRDPVPGQPWRTVTRRVLLIL